MIVRSSCRYCMRHHSSSLYAALCSARHRSAVPLLMHACMLQYAPRLWLKTKKRTRHIQIDFRARFRTTALCSEICTSQGDRGIWLFPKVQFMHLCMLFYFSPKYCTYTFLASSVYLFRCSLLVSGTSVFAYLVV